ncbi:toll/interleukin-1 receptor domain-containing protein [Cupriavidus pampae]|uniref:toll/interleukin-1 receptor domain-containing protein n=1 Tax=Cupriavidus pampae TaxID=659251 RepID=UPI001CC55D5A|nr:toll/interleukin-1 receptor domain-containing protein [Cupriavidus pampae]
MQRNPPAGGRSISGGDVGLETTHYNLLVSANHEAWDGLSWSMGKDRLFEYTNDIVKSRFTPLSDASFSQLQSLPTLFAYERHCGKAARVGRITGITHRNDGYGISFELDPRIPPIPMDRLEQLLYALDIDARYEMNRTHWAVKNVALPRVLEQGGLIPAGAMAPLVAARPPTVFLSYSHDTPAHKAWVAQLAIHLREYAVEVLLDQWHVNPGEDLEAFMRRGVTTSDRVVMVCTETYVRKVLDGRGGVGFEHTLVMGQLMQQLGTDKFVPIIRQPGLQPIQIPALSTRLYIDFSQDLVYREKVEELARTVHGQRPVLPPLGRPPVPPPPLR